MKKWLFLALGLAGTGLAIALNTGGGKAQAQPGSVSSDYGPPAQGATLKQPWDSPAPTPQPIGGALPPSLEKFYQQSSFPNQGGLTETTPWAVSPHSPAPLAALPSVTGQFPPYQESPDINQDIRISPEQGPWVICLISYVGPEAAQEARKLVAELRVTYQLPALVYNTSAEERRQEYERVKEAIIKKRESYRQQQIPDTMPIRVPRRIIQDQYAVMVGGYADEKVARKALHDLRRLPLPDSNKILLDPKFYKVPQIDPKTNQIVTENGKRDERYSVDLFGCGFVGPNPTIKFERPADSNKFKLADLQKLNRHEPFSLLQCPKPVTLVIKILSTPTQLQQNTKAPKGGFLASLGLGGKSYGHEDAAATSAHSLAEYLHKIQINAYVLHTRYCSYVTVGAFDRENDPALLSMQQHLETNLRPMHPSGANQPPGPLQYLGDPRIGLLPRPIPWNFRSSIAGS